MPLATRLRASVVCEAEGHLLVVRLRDPVSGVVAFYPPGGGIEEGEAPRETAQRETLEETGLHVRVDPNVALVETYPFCWAGTDYSVTTHYFAAALEDPFVMDLPKVVDATYNLGASWLPVSEALEAMAIHPAIASAVARVRYRALRARWRQSPNFPGPAATLLSIHDQFRAASERMLKLVESNPGVVPRFFAPLAETLHHHHHAEEAMLFPLVRRRTGVMPEQLVADHRALTDAIAAVEENPSPAAVSNFDEVLVEHLDREEQLVIPVLLELTPEQAWAMIHG